MLLRQNSTGGIYALVIIHSQSIKYAPAAHSESASCCVLLLRLVCLLSHPCSLPVPWCWSQPAVYREFSTTDSTLCRLQATAMKRQTHRRSPGQTCTTDTNKSTESCAQRHTFGADSEIQRCRGHKDINTPTRGISPI